MKSKSMVVLFGVALTAVLLTTAYVSAPTEKIASPATKAAPPQADPSRVARAIELAATRPGISREYVEKQMRASDERKVDTPVADLLNELQPTPEQRKTYYDAHRDRFGDRSLQASSRVIDQLLKIDYARSKLTGTDRSEQP